MTIDGNYKHVTDEPSTSRDKVDKHICQYFSCQRLY